MADVRKAIKITLEHEGGYSPGFTGSGETYKGIDRNYNREWKGWKIIDRIPNKKKNQVFKNPELDSLVINFYKTKMWDAIRGDQVNDQQLANMLFDFYFHKPAIAIAAANEAAVETDPGVIQTNKSKLTLNVIAVMNEYPVDMFEKIKELRIKHYNNGWLNDKYKAYYSTTRKGLLNRANKFNYNLQERIAGIYF